jgi:hypothetical protein
MSPWNSPSGPSEYAVKRSFAGTQKRGGFDADVNLASTEMRTSRYVESNAPPGSAVPLIGARGNLASTDSMKSPLAEANASHAKVKRSPTGTQKRGAFDVHVNLASTDAQNDAIADGHGNVASTDAGEHFGTAT